MKIRHQILGSCLVLSLSGCGLFTNVPAQIKLGASTTVAATVTFNVSASAVNAEVQQPKIVLEGEPGSIGVTYDTISITYLPDDLNLTPKVVTIAGGVRVPSSHNINAEGVTVPGKAEFELPVISSHVVQLGNPTNPSRINSQISAVVTLSGVDDAGWPASIDVAVPINFLSSALER